MQFMMMVKADPGYEAGIPSRPELLAKIGQLAAERVEAPVLRRTEIRQMFDCAHCGAHA